MRENGSEPTTSSSSSPSAKRSRDPEDEVYLDNFHSQKRYLSEIMASSLNGLTVEDSLSANVMESPARSEPMCYLRDEISWQYSPMSEDSDDARCSETLANTPMVQSDSIPTSPVSPHRYHKPLSCFSSTTSTNTSYPLPGCNLASVSCSQPRQRGSDSEGRFPSSPSDICHSADLRRAALLRSVQMRTQPLAIPSYDMPFTSEQEPMQNIEADEHSCLCVKSLASGCECQTSERVSNLFIEDCSSMGMSPDSRLGREKSCSAMNMNMNMNMNMKEEAGVQLCRQNLEGSCGSVSSRRSLLSGNSKGSVDSND